MEIAPPDLTVDLFAVVGFAVGALSLLCGFVYARIPAQRTLFYLAGALALGVMETLVFAAELPDKTKAICVALLIPGAYWGVALSVRAALLRSHPPRTLAFTSIVLVLLSFVLIALDRSPSLFTLPFQLSGVLALVDILWVLGRHFPKSALDRALFVVFTALSAIYLVRIPIFPLLLNATMTSIPLTRTTLELFLLSSLAVLVPLSVILIIAKSVGMLIADYRKEAEHDGLTGLLNRQAFAKAAETSRCSSGSLILLDIDHFKTVNDRYGHGVGDEILIALACLMSEAGRAFGSSAAIARIGGEEFAIHLPDASADEALSIAEWLRIRYELHRHPALSDDHRLSASFGITSYPSGASLTSILAAADKELYRAKRDGRNQIAFAVLQNDPIRPEARQAATQAA